MADLDLLTVGLVVDMLIERTNDGADYDDENNIRTATQADFDRW